MIIPEQKRYQHSDENMLPMINVVFLLLIFFMIAGAISAADKLVVTPPESEVGAGAEIENGLLLIDESGQLALGSTSVSLSQLTLELTGRDSTLPPLQVKADAQAPTSVLFDVMNALNDAGVENIRLLATGK